MGVLFQMAPGPKPSSPPGRGATPGGDVWMVFALEVDASLHVHVEMLNEFVGTGAPRRSADKTIWLWEIGGAPFWFPLSGAAEEAAVPDP